MNNLPTSKDKLYIIPNQNYDKPLLIKTNEYQFDYNENDMSMTISKHILATKEEYEILKEGLGESK